jgi:hypothetical protein
LRRTKATLSHGKYSKVFATWVRIDIPYVASGNADFGRCRN